MNYEQPFENMEGKSAYVIGHTLDLLYFDRINNEWVIESRSYTDDFTKNWYRWIFTGELPEILLDIIPSEVISKAKTDFVMINPERTIILPPMGGIVVLRPYKDNAGNPFYCVIDPEFPEEKK